ncbi:MAG: mandelate racemase/muconate lactonizing enzyme family protein, partial [Actinomycetia bacterium]|nr:mandelate racemase/muconate lactonizing enzyme family protein [Actinomycetes bacterium]
FVVDNPPPGKGGRYFLFVKVTTDGGVTGWGEAYGATFGPQVMEAAIADAAQRYLIGEDPHRIERFWRRAYSSGFSQRPDPTLMAAVSALEMACWDIVGKEADQPVHQLLGGRVHDRLRTYTYLYPADGSAVPAETEGPTVYNDPALAAAAAVHAVEQGFTAVKLDPAGPYTAYDPHQPRQADIGLSVSMMAAIRQAVGSQADILLGTHGQFTPSGAIRLARALEPFDPLWFEEPVPPDAPEAMAQVGRSTSIPVAAGERLTTKYEFAALLRAGAASILQPNLGRAGGILEGKKIAALAEVHHAQIAPHCYCGPVVAAANAQLAACIPNFLILEAIGPFDGFHADLLVEPLEWDDGDLIVTDRPGLGVELDETVLAAHPWDPAGPLHLQMSDEPVVP